MNKISFVLISLIFVYFNQFALASNIEIKVKIHDDIITNFDIESEKKYLFFLNPKLKELEKSKSDQIAKNSLITEIIKKKELSKIFDLNREYNVSDIIENEFLKNKNIKNKSNFLKLLEINEIDYMDIKEKFKIEALWNQLIFNKYSSNLKINQNELKENILNQYKNKKKIYEFNLSEIVFNIKLDEDNNIDNTFLKIKKSINNIGFANTANIFSISGSAKNGGKIGWINELQISEKIKRNIKDLKINQISKPINIGNGYLLIKINDKKEFKQEINIDEQLKKLTIQEKNRQLNNFSIIFFKKLKKNIEIYEY